MAVADTAGPVAAANTFARSVQRRSKGQLLVTFRVPAQQTADGELAIAREVEQGSVAMGWVPTRAWDAIGVAAFEALQAPFLITNYALLQKVVQGALGRGMLAGTRRVRVRTLGLAAFDLHVPLGAQRPMRQLADFTNATLRVPSNSRLTMAILEALGGRAVAIASGPPLFEALKAGLVDGAVTSIPFVLLNGYYDAARYLTVNLVLFPRVDSIAINEQAFAALTTTERSILVNAAGETTRESFVGLRTRDQLQLRLLCRSEMKAVTSTPTQLAALRQAEQPVYAMLNSSRATRVLIAKIAALKKKTKPTRPLTIPPGCAS